MTKRKNKRFRRIFAIFSLVLVLAFTLVPFSCSALTYPSTIDLSFIPNVNLSRPPWNKTDIIIRNGYYIDNRNVVTGSFDIVPYSTSVKESCVLDRLMDIAPYVKVGDTISISWNTNFENALSNKFQWFYGDNKWGDHYTMGTTFTVTEEHLKAFIVLYPLHFGISDGQVFTYSNWRVNYGTPKPFEPYTSTEAYITYLNGIYTKGYLNGYNDAFADNTDDYINQNYVITERNFMQYGMPSFISKWSDGKGNVSKEPVDLNGYPWTGYSLNTAYLPKSAYVHPSDYTIFSGYWAYLNTNLRGNDLLLSDLPIIVRITPQDEKDPICSATFRVLLNDGTIVRFAQKFTLDNDYTIVLDWDNIVGTREADGATYSLSGNLTCSALSIETNHIAINAFYDLQIICSRDNGYQEGYKDGYGLGEVDGYKDGVDFGYNNGKIDGIEQGRTDGYKNGYENGYANGERAGYNKGASDATEGSMWLNLFSAVVNAPVNAITSLFNFSIFGVDMSSFVGSFLLVCAVVAIVKFFL